MFVQKQMHRCCYALLLLMTFKVQSQDFVQKVTPVAKFLYHFKGNIGLIQKRNIYCFPIAEFPFTQHDKIHFEPKYIKNASGLYVIQDGNGIVYKAVKINSDSIYYQRLDSTLYYGYNCQSIRFSYKDTLFSFGGYGFFKFQSQLLYFSVGKDWDIIALNQETPVLDYLNYLDEKKGVLYYLTMPYNNETINREEGDFAFYLLNLNKASTKLLGKSNALFHKLNTNKIKVSCPSLGGVLFQTDQQILLLKFDENSIYALKEGPVKRKLLQNAVLFCGNIFEANHRLYFTYEPDGPLNEVQLSLSDFEKTPEKIYQDATSFHSKLILSILGISVILLLLGYYVVQFRTKKSLMNLEEKIISPKSIEEIQPTLQEHPFNIIEQEFIIKLYAISGPNRKVTVDEIHQILGLKNKSIEVQKKNRTEIINRINYKFRALIDQELDLILRERSADDKRYFLYYIETDSFQLFQNIIGK